MNISDYLKELYQKVISSLANSDKTNSSVQAELSPSKTVPPASANESVRDLDPFWEALEEHYDKIKQDNVDYQSDKTDGKEMVKEINELSPIDKQMNTDLDTKSEVIGKISYYGFNGNVSEVIEHTDKQKYLNAIKKELDYNPTGFKVDTLTSDPEVRKSVENLIYDAYGYDNSATTLCTTDTRTLTANVKLDNDKNVIEVNSPMITDRLTGSSSQLDTKGIDLKSLSGSQMKDLLSGKQVKAVAGIAGYLGLNKTPAGWALSIGKKIVSTANSEAEI
ncbi:MAG: hypothetical protein PHY47_10970 [Lachnospiraceae bacterium]|nr:hypothetical protein [Lachnospiraceae bacterium]